MHRDVLELVGKVVEVQGNTAVLEYRPSPWFYKRYLLTGANLEEGRNYLIKGEKIGPSPFPLTTPTMYEVVEAKEIAYDLNELPSVEAEIFEGWDEDGYPVQEVDFFKCPRCRKAVDPHEDELLLSTVGEEYAIEVRKCPHCGKLYKVVTELSHEKDSLFPITFEVNITGYKVKGRDYARINLPPEFTPLIGKKAKLIPISPREFKLVLEG